MKGRVKMSISAYDANLRGPRRLLTFIGLTTLISTFGVSLIIIDQHGQPVITETAVVLRERPIWSKNVACYIDMKGDRVGLISYGTRHVCEDRWHNGDRVTFHYVTGRLLKGVNFKGYLSLIDSASHQEEARSSQ